MYANREPAFFFARPITGSVQIVPFSSLRLDLQTWTKGITAAVPADVRQRAGAAIAVAGTATSCAAIDLGLETCDPTVIEGHMLSRERLCELLERLAALRWRRASR